MIYDYDIMKVSSIIIMGKAYTCVVQFPEKVFSTIDEELIVFDERNTKHWRNVLEY